jgi:hypothetical protein
MKRQAAVIVSCVFLAGVATIASMATIATMPVSNAQVVNRACQVPGVFTSNGMVCAKVGKRLLWVRQSPGPTIATGTAGKNAPPATSVAVGAPGELPDPCGVVDTKQVAAVLAQEIKLSRPQESPQLRTCSIVSANNFYAGSFAIRNDIEPFLIGGAFLDDYRWIDPADLDPKNAIQITSPAGKTVYSLKTRQYRAYLWWIAADGYKYGVVVGAKLSTEEEQRVVAALAK